MNLLKKLSMTAGNRYIPAFLQFAFLGEVLGIYLKNSIMIEICIEKLNNDNK